MVAYYSDATAHDCWIWHDLEPSDSAYLSTAHLSVSCAQWIDGLFLSCAWSESPLWRAEKAILQHYVRATHSSPTSLCSFGMHWLIDQFVEERKNGMKKSTEQKKVIASNEAGTAVYQVPVKTLAETHNDRLPIDPQTGKPLAPMSHPGYYPGYSTLSQQAFWDEATRNLILHRVNNVP